MKLLPRILIAFALLLAASPALAQTLAAHTVAIGLGAGVQGFAPAGPGTSGQVLTSNGASADPTFQTLSGTGTVTTLSVVSANGLAGTVATPTTTPAITLSTTVNAPVLSGNGTTIAAGTTTGTGSTVVLSGTPTLVTPILGTPTSVNLTNATSVPVNQAIGNLPVANLNSGTSATNTTFWRGDGTWATPGGSGNVTAAGTLTNNSIVLGAGTTATQTVAGFTTDGTSQMTLGVAGANTGALKLTGVTSGTVTITAQGTAGTPTITVPNSSGTMAVSASTPIVLSATTGALTCPTCATSSGGGAVTGTAPVAVSAAGVVSITGAAGQILAGASPAFTATPSLGVAGSTVGSIAFANATSGSITLAPVTGALGAVTLSMPAATDTLVGKATTDIFTNKTYDTAGTGNVFKINGTAISAVTGTGSAVLATTPTLVTPVLGVATATSINKMAITAPATSSTLAVADGKTFTASNSLTLTGTDSTSMAFPATSSTVLTTGNTATITKGYTLTPNNIGTVSSGTTTLDPSLGNYQYLSNNGAFTLAAPASDSAITLLITNAASAGAITFSGFTVSASVGCTLTTTNTNKFVLSVTRVNSVAFYSCYALQ